MCLYVFVCVYRALIGWLYNAHTVRVFKLTKKKDSTTANFQGAFDFDKVRLHFTGRL